MQSRNKSLLHLMHLVSPALPVGAYAYSQGLESAVDQQWVHNLETAEDWMRASVTTNIAHLDAPVFLRLYKAWQNEDQVGVKKWNQFLQASRESAELLLEDIQMGEALLRLLKDLQLKDLKIEKSDSWLQEKKTSFATAFALAAVQWKINAQEALQGFLWSWLENQVAAAIKLIPLGQTQGQHLLVNLIDELENVAMQASTLNDSELGWSLPRLAMASMQHEAQYSRLFRS